MTNIGFVGLGAMGGRIAGRLLKDADNMVYGTNRTPAKATELVERGMAWRDTPREVALEAEVIFSMVTDAAALEAITSGPDGILAGLGSGQIYVDMSTVGPQLSCELAHRVRTQGAEMVDAPVSGSVTAAARGTLAIIAGGPEDAFRAVEPLLQQVGRTVTLVGTNGQAQLLKLAVNISLATQMLAFSEGVLMAARGGIDPELATAVMAGSAIGSPALQARAPLMLNLPEEAWFDVELMHKDIRLAIATAGRLGVPAYSAATADQAMTMAEQLGFARRDIAVLYQALEEASAPTNVGICP